MDLLQQAIDPLPDFGVKAVLTIAALYMLLFTFWPAPVIDGARSATHSFLSG